MSDFVIPPPPVAAVPVAGGGLFPVRRRAKLCRTRAGDGGGSRSGAAVLRLQAGRRRPDRRADLPYPPMTSNLHHEMELVVAIGTGEADIPVADALLYVWGYAAGLDMTRRDLQGAAKKEGKPWDM